MKNIKVSVVMLTYGHEKFIQQAIEGVLAQDCDFNFELLVANDNSPDDTNTVIQKILDSHPKAVCIKYLNNTKNKGMMPNFFDTIKECMGKYIAICEGDDYWVDNLKLQQQVDFLDKNHDYGLIHTSCNILNQTTQQTTSYKTLHTVNTSVFDALLLDKYSIETLTTCFKKQILLDYIKDINPQDKNWLMGDLPLWLYFSQHTKVHFIDQVTSVYRVLQESASQSRDILKKQQFATSIRDIKLYFCKKYTPENKTIVQQINSNYYYQLLVINVILKGGFKDFWIAILAFYKNNRSIKLFIGSFKQLIKKLIPV